MKKITRLLSAAIVSGGLIASIPASADTVYHRVYHQPVTITDPFSILDQYQNNVLTPEEYRKSGHAENFTSVDMDNNGFLSRSEFYGTADAPQDAAELTLIAPAAGGDMVYATARTDIIYRDDPCDVTARRDEPDCR